jgi:hypothetical protein
MGDQAAPEYVLDISHAASSSSQASTCSVEPGSAGDVAKIVSYLDFDAPAFADPYFHSYVSWDQAELPLR